MKSTVEPRFTSFIQYFLALLRSQARPLTATARTAYRKQHAQPVLDTLHDGLDQSLSQVAPKTATGKALNYLHHEWNKLMVYPEDGRLMIDNNGAENAIRPFVIGHKNGLFSHSVNGVKASANLYSLIETAKAHGLEPYAYLRNVLPRCPELHPWKTWKRCCPGIGNKVTSRRAHPCAGRLTGVGFVPVLNKP